MLNGRQRAKRYAETITDLQRLHRQVRGAPEAERVLRAVALLQAAREDAASEEPGVKSEPDGA